MRPLLIAVLKLEELGSEESWIEVVVRPVLLVLLVLGLSTVLGFFIWILPFGDVVFAGVVTYSSAEGAVLTASEVF